MSRSTQTAVAVGGVVLAVVLLALDNLLILATDERPAVGRFLLLTALCLLVAAAIFLYALPAARRATGEVNRMSQAAFALGLLALATIVVYVTALPVVLGAGAIVLGRLGEARGAEREESEDTQRRDETQQAERETDEVSAGERATQGWVAALAGALAALACVVLFVIIDFVAAT